VRESGKRLALVVHKLSIACVEHRDLNVNLVLSVEGEWNDSRLWYANLV